MGIDTSPSVTNPSLKDFVLRGWLWHFLLTLIFIVILIIVRDHYTHAAASRSDILLNLICLPLCWTHTIILLIVSLRKFAKKQYLYGGIYFIHFFGSAAVGFYLYLIFSIFSWAYILSGK